MAGATSRALVLLGATVFCLVLAELAVRILKIGPDIRPVFAENFRLSDNPVLRYELAPHSPDGSAVINADGMRDRDRPREKPPGTLRVATLGDSIAFGFGVERSQVFGAVLERVIDRHLAGEPRVEVLNFGVTGYGLAQVVESLRARALRYAPDLAIYAYCLNDPQAYSLEFENLLARTTAAQRSYLERVAARQLRLYALARYGLMQLRSEGRRYGEPHLWHRDDPQFVAMEQGDYASYYAALHAPGPAWNAVESQLDALASLSREQRLPVLVLLFPVLLELERYPLGAVHRRLAEALRARGLASLDLAPLFAAWRARSDREIGVDPLHPNATGHRLVALAALHALLRAGQLPGRTPSDFDPLLEGPQALSRAAALVQDVFRAAPS